MIKAIFVLAITVALESAYLMFSVGNWVCAMWALASIPWVLYANYLYDNGIGKIKKYNKNNNIIPRNGLGNIKYGIKTIVTDYETGNSFIKEMLIAKLIADGCKIGDYFVLKHNADRIFEGLMINMRIKNESKQAGMVFIMRGVPGSGKTTITEAFEKVGAVIHSADNYHIESFRQSKFIFNNIIDRIRFKLGFSNDEYKFDKKRLHWYHRLNYKAFCKSVDKGEPLIMVDNTNYKPSLYNEYLEYAKEHGYYVCAMTFKPADIELHMKRNIHKCPEETIKHMREVLNNNLKVDKADFNIITEVK
jgi:predicted kinase